MGNLNQAILRLILLEGEDYQEILNKINQDKLEVDRVHLMKLLKSKVMKCAKDITNTSDLERFINDVGG